MSRRLKSRQPRRLKSRRHRQNPPPWVEDKTRGDTPPAIEIAATQTKPALPRVEDASAIEIAATQPRRLETAATQTKPASAG